MVGEAFRDFLVLWVVILSQCWTSCPLPRGQGHLGWWDCVTVVATQVPVLQGRVRGHLLGHLGWADATSIPRRQQGGSLTWAGFTAWYPYKDMLGSSCCLAPPAWAGAAGAEQ